MAVGQCSFPIMHPVAGITLGTANAGIKQTVRDDILVIQMAEHSTCAAVFTQNAFCAAPVHVAKANLAHAPRWLLINSGNANAGTGEQGMQDALATCADLGRSGRTARQRSAAFFYRRHRPAVAGEQNQSRIAGSGMQPGCRQLGQSGPGDHDHRYLSERRVQSHRN